MVGRREQEVGNNYTNRATLTARDNGGRNK